MVETNEKVEGIVGGTRGHDDRSKRTFSVDSYERPW